MDTTIVTVVQNGLRNMEIVERHVLSENVLGGYTPMGSNTVSSGHVRQMSQERTVVVGEDIETAQSLADGLNDSGLETPPSGTPGATSETSSS